MSSSASALLLPLSSIAVFVGLLLMIGVIVLRWRVLSGADDSTARRGAARLGARAGALLTFGLLGAFTAQLLAFNMPPDPLARDAQLLFGLAWGRDWSVQVVLGLLATGAFLTSTGSDSRTGDAIGALLVTALAFTPAFTGHAASHEPRLVSVVADGVHVLASGAWVGTLAAVAATTSWSRDAALLLARIRRFSPVALAAAPVVVATGLTSTWLRLSRVSDLWLSPYGRLLSLKIALFLGVLALGYFNWRRGTDRLAASGDPAAIRAPLRAELLLALAVLGATAFLLATALPQEPGS